ncbi:Crp/Fnr family transcriptional regulator [Saccharopolyspora griseoalba]|uniref:Crp/Fnr family transcriptional regulator n=1 Tax=Saccharopolyspora griseoalba TaxID=1431848 RepID=A0ABW2LQC4_9PSEU
MAFSRISAAALDRAMELLGPGEAAEMAIRQAAWVARCVGRGNSAPLGTEDLTALAHFLRTRELARGELLFDGGEAPDGVWIVQRGRVELSVGRGRKRSVVHVLQPGDVDGDIQHLLELPLPYTAHALDDATALFLSAEDFEKLLAQRQAITRRWLSSVAERLAASQHRVLGLLGRSLPEQVAQLLLDESVDGRVLLPQRTLAAMVGVQRPSLNKVLKDFERKGLIAVGYAAIDVLAADELQKVVDPR